MNRGEFLIGEVSKRSGPSRKGIRPKGGDPMDKRAVSLCPHCDHCPEVVIDGESLLILRENAVLAILT